jgi:hypothetical protein
MKYPQPFKGHFSTPGPHDYAHKKLNKPMTLGIASPVRTSSSYDNEPFSPANNLKRNRERHHG